MLLLAHMRLSGLGLSYRVFVIVLPPREYPVTCSVASMLVYVHVETL